jgi:integrase
MLLLATYGVRFDQARRIKLKDIHWKEGLIYFPPSKGGKPLCFPLYPKVAAALLDYIEKSREHVSIPEVFLQGSPPVALRHATVYSTIRLYYKRAGIQSPSTGLHAIRHAFATKLTKENVPIKNISDLLGHRSIKSTFIYTKVDLGQLRMFCRDWPEVRP